MDGTDDDDLEGRFTIDLFYIILKNFSVTKIVKESFTHRTIYNKAETFLFSEIEMIYEN